MMSRLNPPRHPTYSSITLHGAQARQRALHKLACCWEICGVALDLNVWFLNRVRFTEQAGTRAIPLLPPCLPKCAAGCMWYP